MRTLLPLLGVLALASLPSRAQMSSEDSNPMTQVRQAYPEDPSKIPLVAPDGTRTTLGAVAPKVLLVSVFTSRFGDMAEVKQAPHLMKALGGRKDVAFIALNVDRPKSREDWDTLREVMKENGVEATLYSDAQLSFLAWVNGPPQAASGPGQGTFVRVPGLAIVLEGKRLHGTYASDASATPEEYVAARLPTVNEALKAVGAKPVPVKKSAPRP